MPDAPDTRLIERWLPIAEIGVESTRERTPMTPFPAPNRLHVWWARRPLVASRAAILASLLPADADRNRFLRVLGIHGDPLKARRAIDGALKSGVRVKDPYGYDRAFKHSPDRRDADWLRSSIGRALDGFTVLDPTGGGGSIPFEAARVGLGGLANDLNPVAALIMKATVEWPVRFSEEIAGAFDGLAAALRRRIEERLDSFFAQRDAPDRMDLTYLWARTVTCPYCDGLVPLSPNWRLAPGGAGVRLVPDTGAGPGAAGRVCGFEIVASAKEQSSGTVARGDGTCPFPDCGRIIDGAAIKAQARAGEMGEQLFAVVYKRRETTRTKTGRTREKWVRGYRAPRPEDDDGAAVRAALDEKLVEWDAFDFVPNERFPADGNDDRPIQYGMPRWRDLFSPRQLLCHGTSVEVFRELLDADREAGRLDEVRQAAYGYLALSLDKLRDYNSRMTRWHSGREVVAGTFDRHDFSFKWSYAEMAPLVTGLGYDWALGQTAKCIRELVALVRPDADAGRSGQPGLFNQRGRPGRSAPSGDRPDRGERSRGRVGGGRAETADPSGRPAAGNDTSDPPGGGGPPAVAGRPGPPAAAARRPDPGDADPAALRPAPAVPLPAPAAGDRFDVPAAGRRDPLTPAADSDRGSTAPGGRAAPAEPFDPPGPPAAPPPVTITCKSGDSLDHLADGGVDAVVMDPPYYDNVMYAELSDFFYVWLKRTAGRVFPELFRRRLTDKDAEAVANPARVRSAAAAAGGGEAAAAVRGAGARARAGRDYQERMAAVFAECRRVLKPDGVMTLMFTHKATGAWDALTAGLIEAGFAITASWPVNTEAGGSLHIRDKAAANSTVFLVCRPRAAADPAAGAVYWEDVEPRVRETVRRRAPAFQDAGIRGVDLYLASFGPALEEFSRHWPVRRGTPRRRPEEGKTRRGGGTAALFDEPWDPYAATPEDALDAARREVKRWRLERLTHRKANADLDPATAFFVLAWDAFRAPAFAWDEALRLARAVGIDPEREVAGRLAEKKGADLLLWDSGRRSAKGALGPVDGSRGLIDALHHAAHAARTASLAAARELLEEAGVDRDPRFFAALEAVLEVLPAGALTGAALTGDAAAAGGDFEALYHLYRLAWSREIDEPDQLRFWRAGGG